MTREWRAVDVERSDVKAASSAQSMGQRWMDWTMVRQVMH